MQLSIASSQQKKGTLPEFANLPVCESPCWLEAYQDENKIHNGTPGSDLYVPKAVDGLYTPLKNWQIRILRIEPGSSDTNIVTKLEPAHISPYENRAIIDSSGDEVPYDILSCSWSNDNEWTSILCNDMEFPVLQSLETAMRSLRHAEETRHVWIDTICINQNDLEEKARQVARTFTIFRRARSVKVWLGSDAECGRDTLKYLQRASDLTNHRPECVKGLQAVHSNFARLARRSWFRQNWVRQEVCAADQIYITVGERSLTFDVLKLRVERALQWALSFNNATKGAGDTVNLEGLSYMLRRLSLLKQSSPQDADLLAFNRSFQSTRLSEPRLCLDSQIRGTIDFDVSDERDFVYGTVSMSTIAIKLNHEDQSTSKRASVYLSRKQESRTWPSIFMSYEPSWSVVDVFVNATAAIISQHECLDSILIAHETFSDRLERQSTISLPSWVPDWRNLPHIVGLDAAQDMIQGVSLSSRGYMSIEVPSGERTTTNRPLLGSRYASVLSDSRDCMYRPAEPEIFLDNDKYKLRSAGFILGTVHDREPTPLTRKVLDIRDKFFSETQDNRGEEHVSAYLRKQTKYKQMTFQASSERPIPVRSRRRNLMSDGPQHSQHDYVSDFRKSIRVSQTCLCPLSARNGDSVVFLRGCSMPTVVRRVSRKKGNFDGSEYNLIGLLLSSQYLLTESYRRYWTLQDPSMLTPDQTKLSDRSSLPAEDLEKKYFVFV